MSEVPVPQPETGNDEVSQSELLLTGARLEAVVQAIIKNPKLIEAIRASEQKTNPLPLADNPLFKELPAEEQLYYLAFLPALELARQMSENKPGPNSTELPDVVGYTLLGLKRHICDEAIYGHLEDPQTKQPNPSEFNPLKPEDKLTVSRKLISQSGSVIGAIAGFIGNSGQLTGDFFYDVFMRRQLKASDVDPDLGLAGLTRRKLSSNENDLRAFDTLLSAFQRIRQSKA